MTHNRVIFGDRLRLLATVFTVGASGLAIAGMSVAGSEPRRSDAALVSYLQLSVDATEIVK